MRWLLAVILVLLSGCCCLGGGSDLAIVRGPNRNMDAITIEVDWTTAAPPPVLYLDTMQSQLQGLCDPAVTVTTVLGEQYEGHGTWTETDIQGFGLLHHGNPDAFYLIYANGIKDGEPMVGGYSWGKRSVCVFAEHPGGPSYVQIATLHELTHCLGLVDKYLEMQTSHKSSNGNHCSNPACLMSSTGVLSSPCSACMADLTAGEEK